MPGSFMSRRFAAAPWPAGLKATSVVGAVLIGILTYFAFRAVPAQPGFTRTFGLATAAVLPVVLLASAVLMVTGYELDGSELRVRRLLWFTRISLTGLRRAWAEPAILEGTHRIFGNAGLFSYTGLYQRRNLGRYRLYATDLSAAVVLTWSHRTVVVTPAAPVDFVEHLHALAPSVATGPPPGDA
jgi:hypothetical protein